MKKLLIFIFLVITLSIYSKNIKVKYYGQLEERYEYKTIQISNYHNEKGFKIFHRDFQIIYLTLKEKKFNKLMHNEKYFTNMTYWHFRQTLNDDVKIYYQCKVQVINRVSTVDIIVWNELKDVEQEYLKINKQKEQYFEVPVFYFSVRRQDL